MGQRSMGAPRVASPTPCTPQPGLPVPLSPCPRMGRCLSLTLSPAEDLSDSEEIFPKDITKWNSDDLMDKIESPEPEDTQGTRPGGLGGCGAWGTVATGAKPLLSVPALVQCWTSRVGAGDT